MKKLQKLILSVFILLTLVSLPIRAEAQEEIVVKKSSFNQAEEQFKCDHRKIWIEHALWAGFFQVSFFEGLEDQSKVADKLLDTERDIVDFIMPYYGKAVRDQYFQLLLGHFQIAGKLFTAMKKGDAANTKKYKAEWHRNADDIVHFLSGLNPYWKEEEDRVKHGFYMHLKTATDFAEARTKKDWDAAILAMNQATAHMVKLADTLTEGLIKQFPNKINK